jgi:hypothetical protein
MNELSRTRLPVLFFAAVFVVAIWPSPSASAQGKKTPSGEEFYIIASVDQPKSELLLKRPSEVTLLMKVTEKTKYQDESGKAIPLSDFRAGDTVWVVATGGAEPTAIRIRRGGMTIPELHRYYLDYPEIK